MSGKRGANRGVLNSTTRITEEQAALAKHLLGRGWTTDAVVQRVGCTYSVLRDIRRGRSWGWL